MHESGNGRSPHTDVVSPRRNNYFHGKLMDAYHFELETEYLNAKRWLLNRLVLGHGVLCGLDIDVGTKPDEIIVFPGVAIDGQGREIIVPRKTTIPIPRRFIAAAHRAVGEDAAKEAVSAHSHGDSDDDEESDDDWSDEGWVTVSICYHECLEDPALVLAGDCHGTQPCEPGTIREGFSIVYSEGRLPRYEYDCHIENLLSSWRVRYERIIEWFADEGCSELPDDPCIPLANVFVGDEGGHGCHHHHVEHHIRPFIPTNLLLFEMFEDLMRDRRKSARSGRR